MNLPSIQKPKIPRDMRENSSCLVRNQESVESVNLCLPCSELGLPIIRQQELRGPGEHDLIPWHKMPDELRLEIPPEDFLVEITSPLFVDFDQQVSRNRWSKSASTTLSYQNSFRTKTVFVQFCFCYEIRFGTKTVLVRELNSNMTLPGVRAGRCAAADSLQTCQLPFRHQKHPKTTRSASQKFEERRYGLGARRKSRAKSLEIRLCLQSQLGKRGKLEARTGWKYGDFCGNPGSNVDSWSWKKLQNASCAKSRRRAASQEYWRKREKKGETIHFSSEESFLKRRKNTVFTTKNYVRIFCSRRL